MTEQRTIYTLANEADCAGPDSETSAGGRFLRTVESYADELIAEGGDQTDSIGEAADACVPVYTHDRWAAFVDLAAYQEDISDCVTDVGDLTAAAGVALYLIAERLLHALLTEAAELNYTTH